MIRLPLLLVAFLILVLPLRADEVTLKNGKVMKDLTFVKETATSVVFKTLDGRRLTIAKEDILRHERKPTVLDELEKRKKALAPKDGEGLAKLGLWAREKGLKKAWRPLLKKAIRYTPDHAEARAALGYEKVGEKWLTKADAERRRAKAREAEYKAKGYKKYKGKWVSPAEYTRLKKGLVKHEDRWVTKDIKKKIDSAGWAFADGQWVSPEDKEKIDAGYRKYKGKWKTIEELDEIHIAFDDPWIHQTGNVEVRANVSYKQGVDLLDAADDAYVFLLELLQLEPDLEGDAGKILVICGRKREEYQAMGSAKANDDRSATQSGRMGVFYTDKLEKKRPGACTYVEHDDFARYWVAYGAAQTYLSRLRPEENLNEALFRGLCDYAAASHNGKYKPTWFHYSRFLNNKNHRFDSLVDTLTGATMPHENSGDRTAQCAARAGLAFHFLRERDPAAFEAFFREQFILGKAGPEDLMRACAKGADVEGMNQAFATFLDGYKKDFRPWDK